MKEQLIQTGQRSEKQGVIDRRETEIPSFMEYQSFRAALQAIHGENPTSAAALFDQPASLSRQAYTQLQAGEAVDPQVARHYYTDVPLPHDLAELEPHQYEQLATTFGPDIMRAKIVSDNLRESTTNPLPVGGACLIETWGLQLLDSPACRGEKELQKITAETMIANGPYYSQVTGTMLQGGRDGIGIMYTEAFPWWLRAAELGVENPRRKTDEAYVAMAAATQRRGELVNPDYQQYTLPFDDLQLEEEGHLKEWYNTAMGDLLQGLRQFADPYDPEGSLKTWVRYTYTGPRILDIAKARIKERYGISVDAYDLHVRTKQLDHLRESTFLGKDPNSLTTDQIEYLRRYGNIFALALDHWQMQHHATQSTGFVGFDDLTYSGDILHQTVLLGNGGKKMPRNPNEVQAVLSSPLRLHVNNVDEHFAYIDAGVERNQTDQIAAEAVLKTADSIKIQQRNRETQLQEVRKLELLQQLFAELAQNNETTAEVAIDEAEIATLFLGDAEVYPRDIAVAIRNELSKRLNMYAKSKAPVNKYAKAHKDEIKDLAAFSDHALTNVAIVQQENGQKSLQLKVNDSLAAQPVLTDITILLDQDREKVLLNAERMRQDLESKQAAYDVQIQALADHLVGRAQELRDIPHMPILPLSQNMLISHAMQLSFDPDMRAFVIDAHSAAASNLSEDEKRELVLSGMQQILPKMKTYLSYIMKGGSYPALRFQRTYTPVFS